MSFVSSSDRERRMLAEESALLIRLVHALRIAEPEAGLAALDSISHRVPAPRTSGMALGSLTPAEAAHALLTGLDPSDVERMLDLIGAEERRYLAAAGTSAGSSAGPPAGSGP